MVDEVEFFFFPALENHAAGVRSLQFLKCSFLSKGSDDESSEEFSGIPVEMCFSVKSSMRNSLNNSNCRHFCERLVTSSR